MSTQFSEQAYEMDPDNNCGGSIAADSKPRRC